MKTSYKNGIAMSFGKKVGKNSLLLTTGYLLSRLVAFLVFRRMALMEGPADTGIWSVAVELTGILVVIAGFGLDSLITREIIKTPYNRASIFFASLKLRSISGIVGYLVLLLLVNLIGYDALTRQAVLIMALGMFLEIWAMAADSVFQACDKMQRQTLSQVLSAMLYFSLAWFWLDQGWGLMGIIWANLVSRGLRLVLVLAFVAPLLKLSGNSDKQKAVSLSWLARCSFPLFIATTLGIIAFKIDTVLVMTILGKAETGIYTAGRRMMDLMILGPHIFAVAVFPSLQLARQESNTNPDALQTAANKAMRTVLLVAIPITIGCFVAAQPLIHLLVGNQQYNGAISVLRIVILGLPFISLNFVANRLLLSQGRESIFFQIALVSLVVNVSLNLLLLPTWKINGAAMASVATLLSTSLLYYRHLRASGLRVDIGRITVRVLVTAGASWFSTVLLVRSIFPDWQLGWYSIPAGSILTLTGTAALAISLYALLTFLPSLRSALIEKTHKVLDR